MADKHDKHKSKYTADRLIPGAFEGETVTRPTIDTDPYDRDTPFIAISSRCAHVGCPVRWVDAAERFICPCHGGVYDLLGRRVGGPPVRPLDRFYTRVIGEQLQVGPRFSVNSQLRRFSPRDPGEPLDGVGQYLYPSRPSARKL